MTFQPDIALEQARKWCRRLIDEEPGVLPQYTPEQAAPRLAEVIRDLDEHLTAGGTLPAAWSRWPGVHSEARPDYDPGES